MTRTAAIERLPQAPQLDDTNEWRSSLAGSRRAPGRSRASTTFGPTRTTPSSSSSPAMIPSVNRNPAAKSTSSPGVRIVTATDFGEAPLGCSATRTSSGSSTESSSHAGVDSEPVTRPTATLATPVLWHVLVMRPPARRWRHETA
jgi:hypothetical protein